MEQKSCFIPFCNDYSQFKALVTLNIGRLYLDFTVKKRTSLTIYVPFFML